MQIAQEEELNKIIIETDTKVVYKMYLIPHFSAIDFDSILFMIVSTYCCVSFNLVMYYSALKGNKALLSILW